MDESKTLLVMYGRILGLTPDEMSEIALEAKTAAEEFEYAPASEGVLATTRGRDPKILWQGALVYGYIVDTCTIHPSIEV